MSSIPHQIPIVAGDFGDAEEAALLAVLRRNWLGQGQEVAALEMALSQMFQLPQAIAVHSGTAALHLALLSCGVGKGDLVLVPAFTFVATANAVLYCGATPVLVDVDPRSYNMCPIALKSVLANLAKPPKAALMVHEFGACAPMDALQAQLPKETLVIEDAACAFGSRYQGRLAGTLGTMATFSFHPRKVVSCGEGGFVLTQNPTWAERLRKLRNHGLDSNGRMEMLGFNHRMTDLQAAVALCQIKRITAFVTARHAVAKAYHERLANSERWLPPLQLDYTQSNYQSFVVQLKTAPPPSTFEGWQEVAKQRDQIIAKANRHGIGLRHAAQAIAQLDYYRQEQGLKPQDYPGAMQAQAATVALPIYPQLKAEQIQRVIEELS